MSKPIDIRALDAPTSTLGECPVWSPVEHALYWVDIDERRIHRHHLATGETESRILDGRPGAIALNAAIGNADARTLTVAMEHELVNLDWATGIGTPLLQLEEPGTGNRLNDGRCDPAGRFIVGSMYADTTAGRSTGVLHQIARGAHAALRTNIGVTNGLAFDANLGRMYFADTPTEKVVVFDYDAKTGALANEREFFDYSQVAGKPDGACVDADGCYWSASVYGWAVQRITPQGVIDRTIELPLQKPSMPCFGGPNLDTLFVTTIDAGGNTPSEPGRDGFTPGETLQVSGLGVTGVEEPTFEG